MWRLFYPLRYFRLVNDEKRHIDLWPTLLFGILLALPFMLFSGVPFFHKDGFLDKLLILTGPLTGFYVAALVAAATFVHPDLDKVFKAGPVALVTRDQDGRKIMEHLTRREFVCTIFGYLSFSAFALSLAAVFLVPSADFDHAAIAHLPYVGWLMDGVYFTLLRDAVILLVTLAVAHLAVVTALGLYYLMDRLYRRDREIVTPKGSLDAAKSDTGAAA
jgi:hypothetical protein